MHREKTTESMNEWIVTHWNLFLINLCPVELIIQYNVIRVSVMSRHLSRPISSRPDFLVPSRDFPIGIESEGNGRDENL